MIEQDIKELLLPQVVNAAVRAGAAIMEHYNSCVSNDDARAKIAMANEAAQQTIKDALGPTRIPILSEEGREMLYEERQNWEMFWLVDPLDGTLEFINRNNEFTVNIALMYGGRAVAGVIYVPHMQRLYYAGEGVGAHLKEGVAADGAAAMSYDAIIAESRQLPLTTAPRTKQRIALSRSHTTAETLACVEQLRSRHGDVDVVEQGSSFKFCMLAEGEVDYYVRTSATFEWDTAAGELILSEAGGITTTTDDGAALRYNKEDLQNPWFHCHGKFSTLRP